MGLVRAFKAHGVPFVATRSADAALKHQVVVAYPSISGKLLPAPALRGLAAHVRGGGTLLTFDLAGGGLEPLFGITGQTPGRGRAAIAWITAGGAPEDRVSRFSEPGSEADLGSYAIAPTTAEVIARFDDGSAAVTCRRAGGRACLMGVDLGALATRTMNGRGELIARAYVNRYEPSLDTLLRWVRDLYVEGDDRPFLVETAPAGREGSLILTHDVDYTRSVPNAAEYAAMLKARGVDATFFIQTKYVRDYNDDVFFDPANLPSLKRVAAAGMEIGSHSVAHSYVYRRFPFGTGEERYPDYRPFVKAREVATGGTVLGELRVSKFLLDRFVKAPVVSFRPGELSYPERLPEALVATGYRYSSSLTANSTLSHLPYRLSYGRTGNRLVDAWEFPVTIEDEEKPALAERLAATNAVIEAIARHGGVAVILIHPDVTDAKLGFEAALVDRWKKRLWIGSLGRFGDWWRARDLADIDVVGDAVIINAPQRLDGIVVRLPKEGGRAVLLSGIQGRQKISLSPRN